MECINHPLITAAGNCASCGKPFCQLCLISHNGEQICERCKSALPQKPLHSWAEEDTKTFAMPEIIPPTPLADDIHQFPIPERVEPVEAVVPPPPEPDPYILPPTRYQRRQELNQRLGIGQQKSAAKKPTRRLFWPYWVSSVAVVSSPAR